MTTRTQRCTVCQESLDDHTNLDFILCEIELRATGQVTLPEPTTPIAGAIHQSWGWTLPKRYQS